MTIPNFGKTISYDQVIENLEYENYYLQEENERLRKEVDYLKQELINACDRNEYIVSRVLRNK